MAITGKRPHMLHSHPGPRTPQRVAQDADTVARQLLSLGWVVRFPRTSTGAQTPLLLVSRKPFDASPAAVHVLPNHHLELEAHPGDLINVDDVDDLHHRLNDLDHHRRHHPEEGS